jgi:hypothetical protein
VGHSGPSEFVVSKKTVLPLGDPEAPGACPADERRPRAWCRCPDRGLDVHMLRRLP